MRERSHGGILPYDPLAASWLFQVTVNGCSLPARALDLADMRPESGIGGISCISLVPPEKSASLIFKFQHFCLARELAAEILVVP